LNHCFILENKRNYLAGVTYVGITGTDGVSAGAEAEPHDVDRAMPAAAAMIEMILTSFILYLIINV
jgi:hypothetical protein